MKPVPKLKTWRSKQYLAFVREHECWNCGTSIGIEAHHVNDKNSGMGTKPPDIACIPACARECHPGIHQKPWKYDELYIYKTIVRLWIEWLEKNP